MLNQRCDAIIFTLSFQTVLLDKYAFHGKTKVWLNFVQCVFPGFFYGPKTIDNLSFKFRFKHRNRIYVDKKSINIA
jgi:hypothetical protein